MKHTRRKNLFDHFNEALDLGSLPMWIDELTYFVIIFMVTKPKERWRKMRRLFQIGMILALMGMFYPWAALAKTHKHSPKEARYSVASGLLEHSEWTSKENAVRTLHATQWEGSWSDIHSYYLAKERKLLGFIPFFPKLERGPKRKN